MQTQQPGIYRIEDPQTHRCVRLHSIPAPCSDDLLIVPELTRAELASGFGSYEQACVAYARYTPGHDFDIVRVS